jgi:nucleoside-diphosphate-sugar epimerase
VPARRDDIEFVKCDLRDAKNLLAACHGCDTVFHTAAAMFTAPPAIISAVNVEGTKNVIAACREAGSLSSSKNMTTSITMTLTWSCTHF